MAGMDLEAAVDELYGMPLDGFLPRRTALVAEAKAAGAKEDAKTVAALRKPTVAAWAVNLAVREHPESVDRLTDLATRMRRATERLDGAAIQALGRERTTVIDGLVAATAESAAQAGQPLSPAVVREVGATFVAALASTEATDAVVSGRLTRALEYAGFGDVDLTEAIARPLRLVRTPAPARPVTIRTPPHRATPAAPSRGTRADDQADPADPDDADAPDDRPPTPEPEPEDPSVVAARAAAEARLAQAMATATAATGRHGTLAAALELAENRVAQLQQDLARARRQRDQAADALADAAVDRDTAQADLEQARAEAESLR